MKKWVSHLIDGVMGFFIVGLFGLQITMMISEKNNYGVPSLFGYSFMQVLTDSMAKPNGQTTDTTYEDLTDSDGKAITVTKLGPLSLDQYTGIIIEKADPSSIKVGEVITFYSDVLEAPVTHRVIEIKKDTDNTYVFYTFGDNPESLTCSTWVNNKIACSYPANKDTVKEKYLIGRVLWHNDAFGSPPSISSSKPKPKRKPKTMRWRPNWPLRVLISKTKKQWWRPKKKPAINTN
jgi:PKD repeat protein